MHKSRRLLYAFITLIVLLLGLGAVVVLNNYSGSSESRSSAASQRQFYFQIIQPKTNNPLIVSLYGTNTTSQIRVTQFSLQITFSGPRSGIKLVQPALAATPTPAPTNGTTRYSDGVVISPVSTSFVLSQIQRNGSVFTITGQSRTTQGVELIGSEPIVSIKIPGESFMAKVTPTITQQSVKGFFTSAPGTIIELPHGVVGPTPTVGPATPPTTSYPTVIPTPSGSPSAVPSPNRITIDLLDRNAAFPVLLNRSGVNQVECAPPGYQGNRDTDPWRVQQYTNDVSLCAGSTAANLSCLGALTTFSTRSDRFCYFNNSKSVQFAVNSNAMHDNGCFVSQRSDNASNPGGYGLTLSWDAVLGRSDFWQSSYPTLGQLNSLIISAKASTDYYAQGTCPPNLPPDPRLQTKEPSAFTYLYVIATEANPSTHSGGNTVYYQVITYDSRSAAVHHQTKNNPSQSPVYLDCRVPSTSATNGLVVAADTVEYYGYDMAGRSAKDYSIDVLPRLKYVINQCLGNRVNVNNYKITGFTFGNELQNTANITNTVTTPSLQFVLK